MSQISPKKNSFYLPATVTFFTTILYFVFTTLQWQNMHISSWDLGIFTQLLKSYSNFSAPIVTIKAENYNLLGDHFHPLLITLTPFYKIFPTAFTLIVLQNLLLAVATFFVTHTAIKKLGKLTGTIIGTTYSLSFGVQYAINSQFHEISLAVPLLAIALHKLAQNKTKQAALWVAPLVFVKEDLGLTVTMFGIILLLNKTKFWGKFLILWGLVWFIIATKIVLPFFNQNNTWEYTQQLNNTSFPAEKYKPLIFLLIITVFLPLFSRITLLVIPTLTWRFLSTNPNHWDIVWHYDTILMPIVFYATIDTLQKLKTKQTTQIYPKIVIPALLATNLVWLANSPIKQLTNPSFYQKNQRIEAAQTAMQLIPKNSTVESDIALMSYLVPRTQTYFIGNNNPAPDYIIVDLNLWGKNPPTNISNYAETKHPNQKYELIFSEANYQVAKKQNF